MTIKKFLELLTFMLLILFIVYSIASIQIKYEAIANNAFGIVSILSWAYVILAIISVLLPLILTATHQSGKNFFWIFIFTAILLRTPFAIFNSITISDQLYRASLAEKLINEAHITEIYDYFRYPISIIFSSEFSILTGLYVDSVMNIITLALHLFITLLFYITSRKYTSDKNARILTCFLTSLTGVPSSVFFSPWLFSLSLLWLSLNILQKVDNRTSESYIITLLSIVLSLSHELIGVTNIFLVFWYLMLKIINEKFFTFNKSRGILSTSLVLSSVLLIVNWWFYGYGGISILYNVINGLTGKNVISYTYELYPPYELFRTFAYVYIRIYLGVILLLLVKEMLSPLRSEAIVNKIRNIKYTKIFTLPLLPLFISLFLKIFINIYYDRVVTDILIPFSILSLSVKKDDFSKVSIAMIALVASLSLFYLFGGYTPGLVFQQDIVFAKFLTTSNIFIYQGDARFGSILSFINPNYTYNVNELILKSGTHYTILSPLLPWRYSYEGLDYRIALDAYNFLVHSKSLIYNSKALLFFN